MTKSILDEKNPTLEKIIAKLNEMGKPIIYPITVNTFNNEPGIAWISCNYMGTGLKMALDEIDFEDFKHVSPDILKHCATWTYTDKKKKK